MINQLKLQYLLQIVATASSLQGSVAKQLYIYYPVWQKLTNVWQFYYH